MMNKMKKLTKVIIWAIILIIGFLIVYLPTKIGDLGIGEYINTVQFFGFLTTGISVLALTIMIFRGVASINKYIGRGVKIGAIIAVPLLVIIILLEWKICSSLCITNAIGMIESEAGLIFIWWIYLAEIYTMILGAIAGYLISLKKK